MLEEVKQKEKLCDEVKTEMDFTYLGDSRVSAGGECEAAVVTAIARCYDSHDSILESCPLQLSPEKNIFLISLMYFPSDQNYLRSTSELAPKAPVSFIQS